MGFIFDHRHDAIPQVGINGPEDFRNLVAAAAGNSPVLHGQSLHSPVPEAIEEAPECLQGISAVRKALPAEGCSAFGIGNHHLGHAGTHIQSDIDWSALKVFPRWQVGRIFRKAHISPFTGKTLAHDRKRRKKTVI